MEEGGGKREAKATIFLTNGVSDLRGEAVFYLPSVSTEEK